MREEKQQLQNFYYVYIVACSDNTFYTGITNNLQRRVHEHNYSVKGAKYTRFRRPVHLVYFQKYNSRSQAQKQEYIIKKLTREQKKSLISEQEGKEKRV